MENLKDLSKIIRKQVVKYPGTSVFMALVIGVVLGAAL